MPLKAPPENFRKRNLDMVVGNDVNVRRRGIRGGHEYREDTDA